MNNLKRIKILLSLTIACLTFSLPLTVSAEGAQSAPTADYGFYTVDKDAQAVALSGLSQQYLAETGSRVDLTTLAPVFTLTDAQLSGYDNQPLAEQPLAQQPYAAALLSSAGSAQGFALLQYNYYTPDSEFIKERAAQDESFTFFYNEQVADRLEITEMSPNTLKSFDLRQNQAELERLLPQTGLDKSKLQVRLVNLKESIGYAFLLTDTTDSWLMLLDNNRIRDLLGLIDTKILSRTELCQKLDTLTTLTAEQEPLAEQANPDASIGESALPGASYIDDGNPAPPTGGFNTGSNAPRFHLPVLILAFLLLAAAGGIILYTKAAAKKQ